MTFSGTRFSGYYLLLQGTGVAAWWLWLLLAPAKRALFLPARDLEPELMAFVLPDLAVTAAASLAAAGLFFRRSRWFVPIGWFAAGSMVYAALYTAAWSLARNGGWLSVALMLPGGFLTVIAALDASAGLLPIFRRAPEATPSRHTLATLAQLVVFWTFFLWILPMLLVALEARLGGYGPVQFSGQRPLATVLFVICSALGLTSGWTMSRRGAGTPLPFDAPNRLVVAGPYAYVRNPMVLGGLGQGMAVAAWLGSWLVALYVLLGGTLWELLVRPAEERDLTRVFGAEYESYRERVRCWLPRLAAYRPRAASPGGAPRPSED